MSPRRRAQSTSDLPTGLSIRKMRGETRFRYRYSNGREFFFPIGTSRAEAIQATLAFNLEERPVATLCRNKGDDSNKPLSEWLPYIADRVISEEELGENASDTFLKDIRRLTEGFGHIHTNDISLVTVNKFLRKYAKDKSHNVYNRKISFLSKVFSYLIDESAMTENFADYKKRKPKDDKKRQRLSLMDYKTILKEAKKNKDYYFLYIAMRLALQTTHAVLEVSRIKYKDVKNGHLRIHRQKTKEHEASRVEIPVTEELQLILEDAKNTRLHCPYVVNRRGRYMVKSEGCDHMFQVSSKMISRKFSELRDSLGVCGNLHKSERPTFHEIRALSIYLYDKAGIDPQARAAHKDSKSTKVYKEGHVEWTRVPAAELKVNV